MDDLRDRVALLPCPFCGGRGVDNASATKPFVYCESCDANGAECDTRSEAVETWNTRAALAEMGGVRVQELEWTWHTIPNLWQARSIVGVYEVDTHGSWRLTREGVKGWVMSGGKEAAEADHKRRILAAIKPAPSVREAALIEATDYIRNRLEHIASASWHGDGRDLKRSIQGIFVEYDEALSAIAEEKSDGRFRPMV